MTKSRCSIAPRGWSFLALALVLSLLGPTRAIWAEQAPTAASTLSGPGASPEAASTEATNSPPPRRALAPPSPRGTLKAWLAYKSRTHQFALPLEARLFYRRGLLARDSGAVDQAIKLVSGATRLDPLFVSPRLTLIGWLAFRKPTLALSEVAALIEVARQSFVFQLALAANAIDLVLRALFVAMLVAGLIILVLRNAELRHAWQETLALHVSPFGARVWPWALMVLPYLLGVGLVLPTLMLLAILWPVFRPRERIFLALWAAFLCATPTATDALKRFAHPMDPEQGPLYGIHMLNNEPPSKQFSEHLYQLGARYPDNPYVQFGLGWTSRQAGDLTTAEAAYQRAVALWPNSDRALNNLANVVALQNRFDESVSLYKRAVSANPNNAAAYLNLSQVYTKNFDFRDASEAISHAWALDFELIQSVQTQAHADGEMVFADQWLAPENFWPAVQAAGASASGAAALPPAWRNRIECYPGFGFFVVLCLGIGVTIGVKQARALPLLRCSNCGRVVCRRCSERRRASAFCRDCAEALSDARSYEFASTLLARHRQLKQRHGRLALTTIASILPGVGLMTMNRIVTPLVMLTAAAALVLTQNSGRATFVYEPQLGPRGEGMHYFMVAAWVLLYAWSISSYFLARARRESPAASRAMPRGPRPTPPEKTTKEAA